MRRTYLFLYFILFLISAGDCYGDVLNKVFANTAYMIGNEYFAQRAQLVNGKHEEPYLYVYYEDRFVLGDFNSDGLKDAAVIIAESGGGSGYYLDLAFLINDGKNFVHLASYCLGDRVIIKSLKERKGKVVIDMFIHQKDDCMAGPTKRVRNVYEYTGPEVWGIQKTDEVKTVSSKNRASDIGSRTSENKVDGLEEIYETSLPAEIRRNFNEYFNTQNTQKHHPYYEQTVIGGNEFIDNFAKKFFVIGFDYNSFGGAWAVVTFRGNTQQAFLLQLYALDNDMYDLLSIEVLPGHFDQELLKNIYTPAFDNFWL